jgi:uncharacterized Zn finger protein
MTCIRCQGFMVEDHFLDFEAAFREMWATSWRCLNCGHVHDPVIEQHRLVQQEKVVVGSSAEPDDQDDRFHLRAEVFINEKAA